MLECVCLCQRAVPAHLVPEMVDEPAGWFVDEMHALALCSLHSIHSSRAFLDRPPNQDKGQCPPIFASAPRLAMRTRAVLAVPRRQRCPSVQAAPPSAMSVAHGRHPAMYVRSLRSPRKGGLRGTDPGRSRAIVVFHTSRECALSTESEAAAASGHAQ